MAQAADEVNWATVKANEKIQIASNDAVMTIKKASKNVSKMINQPIDDANEKILQTAGKSIVATVGEEQAEFFDLSPLKNRWANRNK